MAYFADTIIYKKYVKTCSFEYDNDSVLSLKVYIMPNGHFLFNEDEVQIGWIFQKKSAMPFRNIYDRSDTIVEKISNYFPNGLREDCFGCDFGHAFRLHLFSELPIYRELEENMIRISYENSYGRYSEKQTTYHLIKTFFRNDSTVIQYKEGTFVEGEFCCYKNDGILLNKKEMEQISKLEQKISWELESCDCISRGDKNWVVERKIGNFIFSGVRDEYCTNMKRKSLTSMIQLIKSIQEIKKIEY